jgi:hypothetical protein
VGRRSTATTQEEELEAWSRFFLPPTSTNLSRCVKMEGKMDKNDSLDKLQHKINLLHNYFTK